MENPFESGHIKNYILFYSSIVVIMVLFFIAATLFNEVKDVEKKIFSTQEVESKSVEAEEGVKENKLKFKLLDKAY